MKQYKLLYKFKGEDVVHIKIVSAQSKMKAMIQEFDKLIEELQIPRDFLLLVDIKAM